MTTFVFETAATTISFNPNADVLQFNTASAADVVISAVDADTTTFTFSGKTVTVNGLTTRQIAAADPVHDNVLFSNGSVLLVGDGLLDQFGDQNGNIQNGTAGNDQFIGLEGDDEFRPGAGNDRVNGGTQGTNGDSVSYFDATGGVTVNLATAAPQSIGGGMGSDTLIDIEGVTGSNFNDFFTGNNRNGSFLGGLGIDTMSYTNATGPVTVDLEAGTATGTGVGTDVLASIENLIGSNSNDSLTGSDVNNVIEGGAGNDTIDGGVGVDTASYAGAPSGTSIGVTVSLAVAGAQNTQAAGTDTLTGIESLLGSGFNDTLTGNGAANTLSGGAGDDTLAGGAGNDTLDGGTGVDTVTYAAATGRVTVDLGTNIGSGEGFDTLTNIENVIGSSFDDAFLPNAQNNLFDGGAGSDEIRLDNATSGVTVDLSVTSPQNIGGGTGVDTLISIENVRGGAFDDLLSGNAADNLFRGGAGFDTVSYANAPGPITLTVGNFITVTGVGSGTDSLDNFNSIEALIGSSFDDNLTGFRISGVLEGGPGNDRIIGNVAVDTASYAHAPGAVTVSLALSGVPQNTVNAGLDTLIQIEGLLGSAFNDTLTGDTNNNVLEGGAGNDNLNGGAGSDAASYRTATAAVEVNLGLVGAQNTVSAGLDTLSNIEGLVGSKFNDTLTGNAAANVIEGGLGNDVMNGGAGVDTASYAGATTGVTVNLALATAQNTGGAGTDTLSGFENLTGSGLNDTLTGSDGNNVIDGGLGNDTLNGGLGGDTVSYATFTFGGTVNLATGQGLQGDSLSNFENIIGTASNDTLTGDANNNVIEGGQGNDVMDGGAGVDTASYGSAGAGVTVTLLNPGVQQNTVNAGLDTLSNFENLTGSGFNDTLTGDAGNNVIAGGAGNDAMNGGAGTDTASYGSAGAGVTVTLLNPGVQQNTVGAGLDTLTGFENLTGSTFNDTLTGDGGNNTLNGSLGLDTMAGGVGNDVYVVDNAGDSIGESAGQGTDTVNSSVSFTLAPFANVENVNLTGTASVSALGNGLNNVLTGNGGDNILAGSAGNDTLNGGAGADLLFGDAGNDVLDGGAGNDTASYANTTGPSGVTVNLGTITAQNTIGAGTDTISNVENLIGSSQNDTLTGDAQNNVLEGGAGNDLLDGGAGTDTASYASATGNVTVRLDLATPQATGGAGTDTLLNIENLTGSGFDDTLTGNGLNNVLVGAAGIDRLTGGNGNDRLEGGAGEDILFVDAGNDTLDGGAGIDTAIYTLATAGVRVNLGITGPQDTVGAGLDTLLSIENVNASLFNDTLTGSAGSDFLFADQGNDLLDGGAGNDLLNGGAGTDTVTYASATGAVVANLATNQATGAAGTDTLALIENLTGSAFGDTLTGNTNANILDGGAGNDVLNGGTGADTMIGGAGNDIYVRDELGLDVVTEALNAGIDTVQSSGGYSIEANVENLTLTGVAHVTGIGNALNNTIAGNAGNNILIGGAGTDTVSYANATVAVTVDLGRTDQQNTGAGLDTLSEFENLTGSNQNDTLTGNALNNTIIGGAGNDVLNGGAGTDTAAYTNATAAVSANLATGQATGGGGSDTLANFENLTGSTFNDTLTGNGLNNVLAGGAGTDVLTGGAGTDSFHFSSKVGADTVTDFLSGTDKFRFSQAAIRAGDGDTSVEGGVVVAGPGGFAPTAELVIVTADVSGAINATSAAAAIGSASGAYVLNASAIFAVDDGAQAALFQFVSSGADATVSAAELTLLATVTNTASTVVADYVFVG